MTTTVEQKIKSIVEGMKERGVDINYMYNDWSEANVDLDYHTAPFPLCLNVRFANGQLIAKNGFFKNYPYCQIAFLDKNSEYLDGKESIAIVDKMLELAKKFIAAVNISGLFEPLGDVLDYQTIYDMLDQGVTGLIFQFQFKEKIGTCISKYSV